jgi:hypothetical protein
MVPDTLTASNLVAAEQAGEYGLTVPLRVDKVERTPDHDWWAQIVHSSDVLGTHVKLTVFDDDDCDLVDYSFEEGTWYEFDDVNPDVYQGTIGIKAKWDRQVRQLSGRPEMSPSETTDIVRRLGAADAIAALDIETITTASERELEPPNPDHQELLCTGVGYRGSPREEIEAEVLFREDETASAELDAIEAVVNWLDARNVDVLITFGGAWFDLPVLVGRAERAAAEIGKPGRVENVRTALESYYHADLSSTKNRVLGEGSLEDMAEHIGSPAPKTLWTDYETGLEPQTWRESQWDIMREEDRDPPSDDLEDPTVFNSDVPYFGEAWLTASAEGEYDRASNLYACLETYTLADIHPLFALADDERSIGQPSFSMTY